MKFSSQHFLPISCHWNKGNPLHLDDICRSHKNMWRWTQTSPCQLFLQGHRAIFTTLPNWTLMPHTLDSEMATQFSILAWRIPRTEKPGRLQSTRLQSIGHDWATNTSTHYFLYSSDINLSWSMSLTVWKPKRKGFSQEPCTIAMKMLPKARKTLTGRLLTV